MKRAGDVQSQSVQAVGDGGSRRPRIGEVAHETYFYVDSGLTAVTGVTACHGAHHTSSVTRICDARHCTFCCGLRLYRSRAPAFGALPDMPQDERCWQTSKAGAKT